MRPFYGVRRILAAKKGAGKEEDLCLHPDCPDYSPNNPGLLIERQLPN
jgi:hypothetical protein